MKYWQKKIIRSVYPYFKKLDSAHNIEHAERVFKNCLIFARDYQQVDKDALFVAAYLHDLGQLKLKEGMGEHGHLSSNLIKQIFKKTDAPEKKIGLIKQIIETHDKKWNLLRKKLPIEVLIFHDADKIEGIGALGLARQFIYSGKVGKKIWDPNIKRNSSLPWGGNFSALHTILDYQLNLKFYTKRGQKLAEKRKKYMRSFIKEFLQEWNFKK